MISYSDPAKQSMLSALRDYIDSADDGSGGTLPGKMCLYTATRPLAGEAITDQTLVSTLVLNNPCGTVSGTSLVLNTPIFDNNLANSGSISWGRLFRGDDVWICDFDVGLPDDSNNPELKLSAIVVYQGGIIKINSAVFNIS